jgi:hypothetical protein
VVLSWVICKVICLSDLGNILAYYLDKTATLIYHYHTECLIVQIICQNITQVICQNGLILVCPHLIPCILPRIRPHYYINVIIIHKFLKFVHFFLLLSGDIKSLIKKRYHFRIVSLESTYSHLSLWMGWAIRNTSFLSQISIFVDLSSEKLQNTSF